MRSHLRVETQADEHRSPIFALPTPQKNPVPADRGGHLCGATASYKVFVDDVFCGWPPHCKRYFGVLARWSGAVFCPAC